MAVPASAFITLQQRVEIVDDGLPYLGRRPRKEEVDEAACCCHDRQADALDKQDSLVSTGLVAYLASSWPAPLAAMERFSRLANRKLPAPYAVQPLVRHEASMPLR